MSSSRRVAVSLALSVAATVASAFISRLALDRAGGVTRPGGRCCETEFIDTAVLNASWLLVPVLAIAAVFSVRVAFVGLVGVAVPQFWAMKVTGDRYVESGWSQGLEVLGYLFPIGLIAVAVLCMSAGWHIGRRRRQDQ